MPAPISPISMPAVVQPPAFPTAANRPGSTFGDVLEDAVAHVEGMRREANQAASNLLTGKTEDLHGAILANERADLSFELLLEVRNKVVQAYQEIMRMQL